MPQRIKKISFWELPEQKRSVASKITELWQRCKRLTTSTPPSDPELHHTGVAPGPTPSLTGMQSSKRAAVKLYSSLPSSSPSPSSSALTAGCLIFCVLICHVALCTLIFDFTFVLSPDKFFQRTMDDELPPSAGCALKRARGWKKSTKKGYIPHNFYAKQRTF